jgi:DNA-binding NarL/FixJ family response regulator
MAGARYSVVIADDHDLLREEVRADLEERGFDVVAEAGDALGAVCRTLESRPHICLLDVQMPGDGVRAAQAIVMRLPHARIVMLTAIRDDEAALASLRAGASGYLLKDLDADRLADALRRVAEGDLAFPGRLLHRAVEELRDAGPGSFVLAGEDWRVAELLGEGLSAAEVAEETSLGADSVRDRIAWIAAALRSTGTPVRTVDAA